MSELEKIREWISGYPGMESVQGLWVDYYTPVPDNGSIAPAGVNELHRRVDILGTVTVDVRYEFGITFVLARAEEDDVGAMKHAQWILDFQQWVREESIHGSAPVFGDAPRSERILAQDGALKEASPEGTAAYFVRLTVDLKKIYEVV